MNKRSIQAIKSIQSAFLAYSIATIAGIEPVAAEALGFQPASQPQYPAITDSITRPISYRDQEGSKELQQRVLMNINQAVIEGTLSAEDAANLKSRLNKINDSESWYRTMNSDVPAAVAETNAQMLHDLNSKVAVVPRFSQQAENALRMDIDEMIARALANKRISSSDAEKYYMRLAQLESNRESARRNQVAGDQFAAVNQDLAQLKKELTQKN